MIFFAMFSGATITLLAPLFDYVFTDLDRPVIYTSGQEIFKAISQETVDFFQSESFNIFNKDSIDILIDGYKGVFRDSSPIQLLYLVLVIIFIALLLKNLFYLLNRYSFTALKSKAVRDIRNEIFDSYLKQSVAFFNKNRVGDSIVRMVNDVNMISDLYITSIFNIFRDLLTVIIFIFIAMFINTQLFLMSLVIVPIFTYGVSFLGKKIKKYAKRIQGQASMLFSNIEEVLSSMKIVKAFSKEDYEQERMGKINDKYMKLKIKSQIYVALNVPLSELTSMATGIIVILLGARMIVDDQSSFSLGSFTAFLAAIFSMLHPLKVLTKAYTDFKKANVSLDRVAEVIHLEQEIREVAKPVEKKKFTDRIELKNVIFGYKENLPVINDVSFTINKGERIGIVGSSGSGKSTIINLINRLYDYNKGLITIDGIAIDQIKISDLRALFGLVTQESILFSDTIANNITYGARKTVSRKDIIAAAEIAYASEFIEKLEDSYDHMLDTKGSNLSGGQKQRICIARAIIDNPPILIFDEATSALDTDSENNVQIAIEKATKNRTVIMIAHRLSTIINSDKIVVMEAGKVVGIGKHEDLLVTCERYKELYELQYK
jgi:subfamily B ATP-binding cassette protein MsbA